MKWFNIYSFFRKKEFQTFFLYLLLAVGLMTILVILIEWYKQEKPRSLDLYQHMSSYHSGSSGTMALEEILELADIHLHKIIEPLSKLKKTGKNKFNKQAILTETGIMLIIEPKTNLIEKDRKIITDMISNGFIFIIFCQEYSKYKILLTKTDLQDKNKKDIYIKTDGTEIQPSTNIPELPIREMKLYLPAGLRFENLTDQWQIIVSDVTGPIAVQKNIGKGKLILFSESRFLSNLNIDKQDNAFFIYTFLQHYAKNTNIYINEFYHGYQKKLTLLYYFTREKYLYIIFHIIIALLLIFIYYGTRFGQWQKNGNREKRLIYYYTHGFARLLAEKRYIRDLFYSLNDFFYRSQTMQNKQVWLEKKAKINQLIEKTDKKKLKHKELKQLHNILRES